MICPQCKEHKMKTIRVAHEIGVTVRELKCVCGYACVARSVKDDTFIIKQRADGERRIVKNYDSKAILRRREQAIENLRLEYEAM